MKYVNFCDFSHEKGKNLRRVKLTKEMSRNSPDSRNSMGFHIQQQETQKPVAHIKMKIMITLPNLKKESQEICI